MGMDLRGPSGEFRFNTHDWRKVLHLARVYGWEPEGTQGPDIEMGTWVHGSFVAHDNQPAKEAWDGTYLSNDYQRVTDDDAMNLVNALSRAIAELPDYNVTEIKERSIDDGLSGAIFAAIADVVDITYYGPSADAEPIEWFSGEKKQQVIDFVDFCRAGGFVIG